MQSLVNVIFFILSIQILKSRAQWVYDDYGCRTPGGGVGNCVIYTACPSIMNYTKQFKVLSEEQREFINGFKCGFSGNTVKMCCPKSLHVPIDVRYSQVELLPYECGITELQNKIVDGNQASLNEFPWMALLFYLTNNGLVFKCGGTIINERYILTAAHCITSQLISVRVGEHNITSTQDCKIDENKQLKCSLPAMDIKIEKTIAHKEFVASTAQNDIALIRLSKPVNIQTENVKAICLPLTNSAVTRTFAPTELLATGWGITENAITSDVLLKTVVSIVNQEECINTYYRRYQLNVSDKQFCSGGQGTGGTCNGDSGGPLQQPENINDDIRFTQLGIVSLGPKNCKLKGIPTINTRVDQYIDWILENIEP